MSRYYEIDLTVTGYAIERTDDIESAVGELWPFDDWWRSKPEDEIAAISAGGSGNLGGGVSPEAFAEILAKVIWEKNGGFCAIEITVTFVEQAPHETYKPNKELFERLTRAKEQS